MGFFKNIQNIGHAASRGAVDATVGPLAIEAKTVVKAANIGANTFASVQSIAQKNPALLGALGAASGVPLGNFFGQQQPSGGSTGYASPVGQTVAAKDNTILYVAIAGAALLLFIMMKRG